MKDEKIIDAINGLDSDLIENYYKTEKKLLSKRHEKNEKPKIISTNKMFRKWGIVAACIVLCTAIVCGAVFVPGFFKDDTPEPNDLFTEDGSTVPYKPFPGGNYQALAAPLYPDTVKYGTGVEEWKEWKNARVEQRQLYNDINDESVEKFFDKTSSEFLRAAKDNIVYSPINVYLALAMLCEITDGNSRAELLRLLEENNIEGIREQANKIWRSSYCDDGVTTTLMANSFWLSESEEYKEPALQTLAEKYFAYSFSGTMGSEEYSKKAQEWVNGQTNDLLKDYVSEDINFTPETVLSLISTIYFKANWGGKFSNKRYDSIFHSSNGDETVSFMRGYTSLYAKGSNYTLTYKDMDNGNKMWFILPDENVSNDTLLKQGLSSLMRAELTEADVTLNVPAFDVSSSVSLIKAVKKLGVGDVFDPNKADFSPLSDSDDLYVSEIKHSARVKIDEKGVEAAAYTIIDVPEGAIPEERINITLNVDRPFIFVVTNEANVPLFTGVVNHIS